MPKAVTVTIEQPGDMVESLAVAVALLHAAAARALQRDEHPTTREFVADINASIADLDWLASQIRFVANGRPQPGLEANSPIKASSLISKNEAARRELRRAQTRAEIEAVVRLWGSLAGLLVRDPREWQTAKTQLTNVNLTGQALVLSEALARWDELS